MTKQSIKKNFWVLAFSGLLAILLLPTDSFAQSRKISKRKANDTYQATAKKRPTATRDYTHRTNTRTKTTVAKRNTPSRTATRKSSTKSRATANKSFGKRKVTKQTRTAQTRATNTSTYNNRRAKRANKTNSDYARRSTNTRVNNRRNEGARNNTAPATNYNYRANERNDYCNNYYRGLNNWNRSFWTSVNYTPAYYDLSYRRFPYGSSTLRAQKVRYLGQRYWLYDGVWFKKRFGRYYAVDAPIGICVDYLPIAGDMIWYRGEKYVIYRGTAYRMLPFGGFQVVQMLSRF